MKDKSSFLSNCYEWLFNEEERGTVSYIVIFFMIIIMSSTICLFIISIDRHMNGIINWIFQ